MFKNILAITTISMVFFISCRRENKVQQPTTNIGIEWAKMALYITKNTPSNSPTFASRAFAYIGLTMYESVVHSSQSYNSMAGQLNGLDYLPLPPSDSVNWNLVLNAGQAELLKNIYLQTSDANKAKIDSLETVLFNFYSKNLNMKSIEESTEYGQTIAQKIFEWSKTDGGHRGYLKNFDKEIIFPNKPGSWKPPLFAQSFSHYPLHPHWGKNRRFVEKNDSLPFPNFIAYDTLPESEYYRQFLEVYEKDKVLTKKEKEAAIWWGDDPDVTFTPPGHSFYIATLALEKEQPDLIKVVLVYAQTGIAVADAFTNCWQWKYHFFSERANTFIPKFIDEEWESFWPDPPFPAFPSGHAIQASAAATILEENFGKNFNFIDRAHEGRPRDDVRDTDFVSREFNSFWEAAIETADSRFYGGIHTRQDNEVGLQEGKKIANNVLTLKWTKN
ncbi:vanadium-dependent haloperoxidase [Cytophaga sp. FL35]|nr:vanadium-dependent haloperoxidase [Cytophaga sp. FL35]